MIYVQEALISSHDRQAFADLNSVQQFLAEHGNALANAIYQLGGASISGSVFCLIHTLRGAWRLNRSQMKHLERLSAMLHLEQVGGQNRGETTLGAELTPISDLTGEICLLANLLDGVLANLGQSELVAVDNQETKLFKAA
jgi:hypothetical protein